VVFRKTAAVSSSIVNVILIISLPYYHTKYGQATSARPIVTCSKLEARAVLALTIVAPRRQRVAPM